MNRVRLFQFHNQHHRYAGRLYFPEQLIDRINDDRVLDQRDDWLMHDGAEFRKWCWEHRIPIHGLKHAKHPDTVEHVLLTDDQRFEFKMRWGY